MTERRLRTEPGELPGGFLIDAPELPKPVLFDQKWCDLAFIHWPVRPESVAHLFPSGVRPDVFADGLTYVALVPFAMRDAGLGRRPAPYFGTFLETNIRLYSVDDAGRHGVLFRSLETSRLAIVPAALGAFGIPYKWARMRSSREGDVISYESVRRWPDRGPRSRVVLRIGDAVEPTPLEIWLTARWGAHSRWGGRTIWTPNEHGPWPLRAAEVLELDDELLGASEVSPVGPRLRALWSTGVRARFSRPRIVR